MRRLRAWIRSSPRDVLVDPPRAGSPRRARLPSPIPHRRQPESRDDACGGAAPGHAEAGRRRGDEGASPRSAWAAGARLARSGSPVRHSRSPAQSRLHGCGRALAGPGHRRQHRDLLAGGQPAAPTAAREPARSAGTELRRHELATRGGQSWWTNPVWEQIREPAESRSPERCAFGRRSASNLAPHGEVQAVEALLVSGRFFDVLGVPPRCSAAELHNGRRPTWWRP